MASVLRPLHSASSSMDLPTWPIALSLAALLLLLIGWVRNRASWKARDAQWVQGVIDAGGDVRGDLKTRLKLSWAVQTAVEKWSVVGVVVALVQLADGLASRYLW